MWEAFQQFSAVGQKLAAGGGSFVPGLYLVAIGLKLLNEIMDTNASADVSHKGYLSASGNGPCITLMWLFCQNTKCASCFCVVLCAFVPLEG